ncbi:CRISPR-associated endonuclease Cas1 [Micromonospora rifamycinica]|uniref:CRISPR-associated endonuclease Cas1 n=1 Tax=Micromonospora rifamycinica TaxID=291594 RepID=UPI0034219143
MHTDTERRPSLALDLIGEFRPLVVDQAITTLARANQLRPEQARTEDGRAGILLTEAGRAALIDAHERRMLHTTRGALPGFTGSLHRQAQHLAAHIDHSIPFTGLSWR